ncbi:MAG: YdcF family protein [Myxococcales bacterium]
MFLFLSKTLDWMLSPLSWTIVLATLALVLRRRRGASRTLGIVAALVLLAFSTEPVANALFGWAESGATRTYRDGEVYDAVIVLGGGMDPDASVTSGETELNAAGERVLRGWELMRAGKARYLLLSAGSIAPPGPDVVPEAVTLGKQLVAWGLDPALIVQEAQSRNTRENATESAKIVADRGWKKLLLVTSAAHMPRALGCFRAVGLEPDTLPVDHRYSRRPSNGLLPRASNLSASADAIRELAGRAIYRVMGYTR